MQVQLKSDNKCPSCGHKRKFHGEAVNWRAYCTLCGRECDLHEQQAEFEVLANSTDYKDWTDDPVNHPSHYTSHPSGIECIQITEHMNFCLGNSVKYIWRAGLKSKNQLEDLEKAAWYLDREIQRLKTGSQS